MDMNSKLETWEINIPVIECYSFLGNPLFIILIQNVLPHGKSDVARFAGWNLDAKRGKQIW